MTYLFLALIVFFETGLVLTPFLPGDSLLFAAGMIAGLGGLDLALLIIVLYIAAFSGDNTNYFIGKFIGHKVVKRRLVKQAYIDRTHEFYEKHGGKTVIIARWIPIIRTFAPFVAGLGTMIYKRFILFSLIGNLIWICSFTIAGYFFGNIPFVKNNFSLVTLGIIILSVTPIIIAFLKNLFAKKV
jgi:membrane-associated protein